MGAIAHITGVLFSTPSLGMNRKGQRIVTATMRLKGGGSIAWWKVIALAEPVQQELVSMRIGSVVSVRGRLQTEVYKANSLTPDIVLSIVADSVSLVSTPA
ncbi:hypothetical protein WOC76_21225 [Methylocystis sp. IM3]|uniref:hypothetical protein n=1 Tax=unclassified Methylocystis TaxID=2625913 RepID=UPI0030FB754A